jgi:hypothetical protein
MEVEEQIDKECQHVTELMPGCDDSALFIDGFTRLAFAAIVFKVNTIHMLAAPAGSGKTESVKNLGVSLITADTNHRVMVLTFNRAAQADGQKRTAGHERIYWRTIDSVIGRLYKTETKASECVNLRDEFSVKAMADRVLGHAVALREVKQFKKKLERACETNITTELHGTANALFEAGLRGRWWSYSLLRIRALSNPAWRTSMQPFGTIVVDEAQDVNLVMAQLIAQLHSSHMVVYVRDLSQKIYSFMNCVDIAEHLEEPYTAWSLYVTFRFGQRLCDYIEEHGLSSTRAFPAPGTPDTQIEYIDDADIIAGPHTVIMSGWEEILKCAEVYMSEGRKVYIDEDKKLELLKAARSSAPSVFDWLFRKIPKSRIMTTLMQIEDDTDTADDLVILMTLWGAKGLQWSVVRVWRSVIEKDDGDDYKRRYYVSVTRAMDTLYLPPTETLKRKLHAT